MSLYTASYFYILFLIWVNLSSTHDVQGWCPSGWIKGHQSCYILLQSQMTWYEAVKACNRPGISGLVVPNSQNENNFITLKVAGGEELWIDCTDSAEEGTWLCGGIKRYDNMNWYSHPANSDQLNCVRLTSPGGYWNDDIPCDGGEVSPLPFAACEMQVITDPLPPIYHIFTGSDGRIPQQCLYNHGIKNLTGAGVLECGRACLAEPRCNSFNVWQSDKTGKKCQLNNATRRVEAINPDDFKPTDNCFYFDL